MKETSGSLKTKCSDIQVKCICIFLFSFCCSMADVNVFGVMIDLISDLQFTQPVMVIVSGCNPPALSFGCAYINRSYSLTNQKEIDIYIHTHNTLTWSNQIWHHFCLHVQL